MARVLFFSRIINVPKNNFNVRFQWSFQACNSLALILYCDTSSVIVRYHADWPLTEELRLRGAREGSDCRCAWLDSPFNARATQVREILREFCQPGLGANTWFCLPRKLYYGKCTSHTIHLSWCKGTVLASFWSLQVCLLLRSEKLEREGLHV